MCSVAIGCVPSRLRRRRSAVDDTIYCGSHVDGWTTGNDDTCSNSGGSQGSEAIFLFSPDEYGLYVFDACDSTYDTYLTVQDYHTGDVICVTISFASTLRVHVARPRCVHVARPRCASTLSVQ